MKYNITYTQNTIRKNKIIHSQQIQMSYPDLGIATSVAEFLYKTPTTVLSDGSIIKATNVQLQTQKEQKDFDNKIIRGSEVNNMSNYGK